MDLLGQPKFLINGRPKWKGLILSLSLIAFQTVAFCFNKMVKTRPTTTHSTKQGRVPILKLTVSVYTGSI